MIFRQLFDRESCTYTYLVADEATREAGLVDPVREHVGRDLAIVGELGLTLVHVLETHVHADHITGAGELRKSTGCTTHVAREGGAPCADDALDGGDVVRVGAIEFRALATPGHTGGCMSYLVGEGGLFDRVLTGDALLIRGCGRTDFQGGDARTLYRSVRSALFTLDDATLVYPAHDYRGMTLSTIGEEKRHNPRLKDGISIDEFVAKMAALNLPPPLKIDIAVAANRACGEVRERVPQG
jgi:glyoxylase-like metal-dependent hydrolase (beta-lactamase superfamily II)